MIIYKTTNLLNGKIYIGQDKKRNVNYLGSGKLILQAIKKYGKENFKKEVLEKCSTQQQLNEKESYWITFYNATDKNIGYNILPGGYCHWNTLTSEVAIELKSRISNSLKGRKLSNKTREKMSKTHSGKHKSQEHCKNISISKKGNKYRLGKPCSEETKNKISISNTGKKRSEEFIQKQKNKIVSLETRLKLSQAHKGFVSEETKLKISLANKGRVFSDEHKRKLSEAKRKLSKV